VQHMQGWRGAIMIHDERERDECVTERDGVCATNANGCNGCGCATNVNGVQRMRTTGATNADRGCNECKMGGCNECCATNATGCNKCGRQQMPKTDATNAITGATNAIARRTRLREQWMLNRGCANCASGHGVRVTRIRSGGVKEC
jgi:hypothetical protein